MRVFPPITIRRFAAMALQQPQAETSRTGWSTGARRLCKSMNKDWRTPHICQKYDAVDPRLNGWHMTAPSQGLSMAIDRP